MDGQKSQGLFVENYSSGNFIKLAQISKQPSLIKCPIEVLIILNLNLICPALPMPSQSLPNQNSWWIILLTHFRRSWALGTSSPRDDRVQFQVIRKDRMQATYRPSERPCVASNDWGAFRSCNQIVVGTLLVSFAAVTFIVLINQTWLNCLLA
jgi:hypothetical protein